MLHRTLAVGTEIVFPPFIVGSQVHTGLIPIQVSKAKGIVSQQVHIETDLGNSLLRNIPLGNKDLVFIFPTDGAQNLTPEKFESIQALISIIKGAIFIKLDCALDEMTGHIYPETVNAHIQIVAHHNQQFLSERTKPLVSIVFLPGLIWIGIFKAVVQGRLTGIVVGKITAIPVVEALDQAGIILKKIVGPYIVIPVFISLCGSGFFKPGMLIGGMTDDQIHQHTDVPGVEAVNHLLQIFHRTKALVDLHIVSDIIAAILERGFINGVQPHAGNPQVLQIIHFFKNALQVTFAIPVAVIKRNGINLIKYCII